MPRQWAPVQAERARDLALGEQAYHRHRDIEDIVDASQTQQVLTGRQ
jgi:hypothetical protein